MWKTDFICHHGGFFVHDAQSHVRLMKGASVRYDVLPHSTAGPPKKKEQEPPLRPTPAPLEPKKIGRPKKRRAQRRHVGFQKRLIDALIRNMDVSSVELEIGYSIDELRVHLERQFQRGMRWDNHASNRMCLQSGKRVWHIDHILPKSKFEAHQVRAAFALSNLRPIWAKENFKKAARREHLL